MTLENKQLYKSYLNEFSYPNKNNYEKAVRNFFSEEASINVVHPINKIKGSEDYINSGELTSHTNIYISYSSS